MAETFAISGGNEANLSVPSPFLQGTFIPGIDIPDFQDGFGLSTPFGGGGTARRYDDYGVLGDVSSQSTQLNDLSNLVSGGDISYNFEGLIGPQGEPGINGITTIIHLGAPPAPNSNFLTALPNTINQINDLGTATDKMIYTSTYTAYRNFVWANTPIADIKSWNDSAINNDGTFFAIAADTGIYISIDGGDSWNTYTPRVEIYNLIACAASGGKAIALGDDSRIEGVVMVTSNYGVAWTEKTVTV